jgi:fumarate reductase subunit D
MARPLKRSWQPPFWLLFGAGGMLSALVGWMLVLVTGIAAPLGAGEALMSYDNVAAFARNPLGKLFMLAVVALFLFHGAHRIYHSLHDFGVRTGAAAWLACYGVAIGGSLAAASTLLRI